MSASWKRKKRRARIRRLRNRLQVPPLQAGLLLLSLLPLRAASRLGAALGRIAFAALPGDRRRALDHLSLALGDRHPPERLRRIALDSFRLLGACALEWVVLCRLGPARAARRVTEVRGWEHLARALARGRGAIVATAHFGLFELMPVCVHQRGAEGKVVGRRRSEEGLEALVVARRRRMGVETIPQQQPREILRVLRRGEVVGLLPDQDVDKLPGTFVPFFGRLAYTPVGPATLSVATGAPILPAFMHRTGPGRHRLEIHPPVPDPGGGKEDRIAALTEAFTRVFEREISASPEHWAWIHERWSTTPETLARRRSRRSREEARVTRRRIYGRGGARA